jgi:hypothetical protein
MMLWGVSEYPYNSACLKLLAVKIRMRVNNSGIIRKIISPSVYEGKTRSNFEVMNLSLSHHSVLYLSLGTYLMEYSA